MAERPLPSWRARPRLSRSSKLYATGRSTRTNVRLHALRKVEPGNYTLVVEPGEDVTVRIQIRLS